METEGEKAVLTSIDEGIYYRCIVINLVFYNNKSFVCEQITYTPEVATRTLECVTHMFRPRYLKLGTITYI